MQKFDSAGRPRDSSGDLIVFIFCVNEQISQFIDDEG